MRRDALFKLRILKKNKNAQGKIQYYNMTLDLKGPTSEAKNRLTMYLNKLGVLSC